MKLLNSIILKIPTIVLALLAILLAYLLFEVLGLNQLFVNAIKF